MLEELRIENLAVIPAAGMSFSPGLNVISGETGAGKTILAQAIALLLGVRADSGLIRPETENATVEAVFTYPRGFFAHLEDKLELPDDRILAVRRRLSRTGQSRAYVGGRVANLSVLEQLTGRLMAFSAQHEHRRLMMAANQLDILDGFCGPELLDLRDEYRALYDRRQEIIAELETLNADEDARRREMELLDFQAGEIEAARLSADEEEELVKRRQSLQRADELREVSAGVAALLGNMGDGEVQEGDIMEALSAIRSRLDALRGVDSELDRIAQRLEQAFFELEDLGAAARDYHEGLESDPGALADVEERLDLLSQLKRKYGVSVREVIASGEKAREKLAKLHASESDRSSLDGELSLLEREMLELVRAMRKLRQAASGKLSRAVEANLGDLAFTECGFEVELAGVDVGENQASGAAALTRSGADEIKFLVRLNPGMPAAPLRDTASGGELSRILLAVKCAVSGSGEAATLVFDEIDAGIGGETGSAVGAKLKQLSRDSQVICITHLPQIACFADAHFSVSKNTDEAAGETVTDVRPLEGGEIVDELCRMMGSRPDDEEARAHAESLMNRAASA